MEQSALDFVKEAEALSLSPGRAERVARWAMKNPHQANFVTGAIPGAAVGAVTKRREGESKQDYRKRRLKRMSVGATVSGGLSVVGGDVLDKTQAGKKLRQEAQQKLDNLERQRSVIRVATRPNS